MPTSPEEVRTRRLGRLGDRQIRAEPSRRTTGGALCHTHLLGRLYATHTSSEDSERAHFPHISVLYATHTSSEDSERAHFPHISVGVGFVSARMHSG